MREDAHDDKTDSGPRHALMQTYVDDPIPAQEEPSTSVAENSSNGQVTGGMPQVV